MEFPIRHITHILERKAINIISRLLPEEWIVRELTERDYGIDLYVEIVREDRKLTGNLVAIQIKGTQKVKFNEKGEYTFTGIKRSTINYWIHLPVPVFFVVVCLKTNMGYWADIKELNRQGHFKKDSKTTSVKLLNQNNFEKIGMLAFDLYYIREVKWPAIETAIENALMSFTSFGPFCLICKRKPENEICSSTIQYLLLQHYDNYYMLSRYLNSRKPDPIKVWYEKHVEQLKNNQIKVAFRFSYALIREMIMTFASDYREAVRKANLLVVKHQAYYFSRRFPLLYLTLKERPLTFVMTDWFSRYYWDEYENETRNIEKKFFDDFKEFDGNDLINDLNE